MEDGVRKEWEGPGQGPWSARALISCLIKWTPKRAASCRGKKPTHCEASKPLLATGEWRENSRLALLLFFSSSTSCFMVLRANTVNPANICVYTDFTCIVSPRRSREREKEIERDHGYVLVWVHTRGTRRKPKIKHGKSIAEEKRGNVFRPNYMPPLALHAVAVAAAATALQGASSAQLTKGADTNDSNPRMFRGEGRGEMSILAQNVGRRWQKYNDYLRVSHHVCYPFVILTIKN